MLIKSYEYNGYLIELSEHPIYHDFQFVVRTLNEKEIKATSINLYDNEYDAEIGAQLIINTL
jgi:hypothetical protein